MNDYAHLRLHEASIRGTARPARHHRSARRQRVTLLSRRRHTEDHTGAAMAGHPSQVRTA